VRRDFPKFNHRQIHDGEANYEAIGRVKAAVKIPVWGNGDVVDGASARRLREVSGCDGVMLGRGALGNPWIYQEVEAALEGKDAFKAPDLSERKKILMKHIDLACQHTKASEHVGPMRRVACWYFKDIPGVRAYRNAAHQARHPDVLREIVDQFIPG